MKKKIHVLLAAMVGIVSMITVGCTTASQPQNSDPDINGEVQAEEGSYQFSKVATNEQSTAAYWLSSRDDANSGVKATDVWMTAEEISELNQEILSYDATAMYDLENMEESYNADEEMALMLSQDFPENELYINGELVDGQVLKEKLLDAIDNTGYSGEYTIQYAVVTSRADVKSWPVSGHTGYSEIDCDDEFMSTSLNINEPFIIKGACTIDDEEFFWGYCNHYSGWIQAKNVALCTSKEQWLEAWKVDADEADFVVVTQDKITLEDNLTETDISGVKLMLGTILKTVPEQDIPTSVGERGIWNNYVVYLPTRDDDGFYVRQIATISQHENVSVGFLPMTSENVLDLAFSCLGDRYGWGGMLGALDCSLFTRNIYRCFGLEMPRDTRTQASIPGKIKDVSDLSDEEKSAEIAKLPAGSILFFPGHVMIYLGTENDVNYVISATGSLKIAEGADVSQQYSVIVTPLSVYRRNDTTWLSNIEVLITFAD